MKRPFRTGDDSVVKRHCCPDNKDGKRRMVNGDRPMVSKRLCRQNTKKLSVEDPVPIESKRLCYAKIATIARLSPRTMAILWSMANGIQYSPITKYVRDSIYC